MNKNLQTNNDRVLVTGGAGFIGCAISQILAPLVKEYIVVDSLHPQVHKEKVRPNELHTSAKLTVADVTEKSTWDALLQTHKPDVVIHLAAETGTGQSLSESTRHGYVNVVGTTQMLDGFTRHSTKIKKIILSSSRAVYGEGAWIRDNGEIVYPGQRTAAQLSNKEWDFPGLKSRPCTFKETMPNPSSIYGATKLAQEHILKAWCLSNETKLNVLRLQNVYGAGQSLSNPYTGIVSLFSQLAKKGQSIPVYEDGDIVRDFVYIDDVANAFYKVYEKNDIDFCCFDIGTGQDSKIIDVANLLAEYHGALAPVINEKYRNGDVRKAACRIDDATMNLGWRPEINLKTGIEKLQMWIDTSGVQA